MLGCRDKSRRKTHTSHSQTPSGGSQNVPRLKRIYSTCIIPLANSESALWCITSKMSLKHFQREIIRGYPNQISLNHLSWFISVQSSSSYFELSLDDSAPYVISKAEPNHPEKAHFTYLYLGSCPFGHDRVMDGILIDQ